MEEYWDVYDENKKKTGETVKRFPFEMKDGQYHIVVSAVILNSLNEILISKRAEHKKFGLMWELNGGSILSGETSLEGILREVNEELGIEFTKKEAIFLKDVKRKFDFKDLWVFKKDIDSKNLTFPDKEAIEAKFVTIEEFVSMFDNGEIVPTVNFGKDEYEEALKISQRQSYGFIGKNITVKIDRKLGSLHPKHGFEYLVNYGFVPNILSADGEELDCYVLGIEYPVEEFTGKCVAVIHRINDDDDKLIIVPNECEISDKEIREKTFFQEKFFESEIIR